MAPSCHRGSISSPPASQTSLVLTPARPKIGRSTAQFFVPAVSNQREPPRSESEGIALKVKVTVIYGGGGAIGGAVARAFGAEGARVFLGGRHRATLKAVAENLIGEGGSVDVPESDAL